MSKIKISMPKKITKDDWKYYLSYTPGQYLYSISNSLKYNNRFFADERFNKLICYCLFDKYTGIESNSSYQSQQCLMPILDLSFFRARKYTESDAKERFINREKTGVFQGYDKEGSGAPPQNVCVGEGRVNPENIRYLYIATDIETAALEIAPKAGEYISIATLKLRESVHLFDVSKDFSILEAKTQEQTNWIQKFYSELNTIFQKPYIETGDYYLCQYICEYVKLNGMDGVLYNSSKNPQPSGSGLKGKNITIFNPDKCEVVSSSLHYIIDVKLNMTP